MPNIDGLEAVTLSAGELEAVFVPGAGMIGASLRHAGDELLGQRGGVAAYAQRGSTMGIPLLHPWANRLAGTRYRASGHTVDLQNVVRVRRDEHALPIHGLLHAWPDWEVLHTDDQSLRARADLSGDERVLAGFPFPHVLEIEVDLDEDALTICTELTATDFLAVPVSFGFHPYFTLPGADRGEWVLELPARRHLLVDHHGIPTGETEHEPAERAPLGTRTFDDGYDELGSVPEFAVTGGGRRIAVRFLEGFPVAQVFAPADQDVVCFEPMTAPTNALCNGADLRFVEPAATLRTVFTIAVSRD